MAIDLLQKTILSEFLLLFPLTRPYISYYIDLVPWLKSRLRWRLNRMG